jgi:hypothetical protein
MNGYRKGCAKDYLFDFYEIFSKWHCELKLDISAFH